MPNRDLLSTAGPNPEVEGVIESYELAFRMQSELPDVMDFSKESPATLATYGIGEGPQTMPHGAPFRAGGDAPSSRSATAVGLGIKLAK